MCCAEWWISHDAGVCAGAAQDRALQRFGLKGKYAGFDLRNKLYIPRFPCWEASVGRNHLRPFIISWLEAETFNFLQPYYSRITSAIVGGMRQFESTFNDKFWEVPLLKMMETILGIAQKYMSNCGCRLGFIPTLYACLDRAEENQP